MISLLLHLDLELDLYIFEIALLLWKGLAPVKQLDFSL